MLYILWGISDISIQLYKLLSQECENEFCFCDNNITDKKEKMIGCNTVINPFDIRNHYIEGATDIVICANNKRSITEIAIQLKEMGYNYTFPEDIGRKIVADEAHKYDQLNKREEFRYREDLAWFIPFDRLGQAGEVDSYFWQDLWCAHKIYKKHPSIHYDIGSRLDGLIAHLLSFGQSVRYIDIRPLPYNIRGLEYVQGDATSLANFYDEEIESLSAICSIEHFGLGRYGDEIDPEGCFKFIERIQRKIKKGGALYISVPVGNDCVQFNAHRIFNPKTIIEEFKDMNLCEFSLYRNAENRIINNIEISEYKINKDCYGDVGLFCFEKKGVIDDCS